MVIYLRKLFSMKSITTLLSTIGRWAVTTFFCVSAIAFGWQGGFLSNTTAIAAPGTLVIAARTETGSQVQRDNKNSLEIACLRSLISTETPTIRVARPSGSK